MNKIFKINLLFILTFLLILVFSGCSSTPNDLNNNTKINQNDLKTVYTSFYPIYDFTSKIAGEKLNVKLIIPAGAEPHEFEISPKILAEIEQADLIVINGLGIESFADKIPSSIASEKLVNLEQYTDPLVFNDNISDYMHENEINDENHIKYDPHVWLDPMRAMAMSKAIYESIIKIDPDNLSYYQKNYETLATQLEDLDKEYKKLDRIKNKKQIIVSHNAFSYLAKRYDIKFTSISGISGDQEASLKDIARIIDIIKKDNINTVFLEELSNDKIASIISSETSADVDILYTIEGMTPEEIKNGQDYFYKMKQNLENITKAIQ